MCFKVDWGIVIKNCVWDLGVCVVDYEFVFMIVFSVGCLVVGVFFFVGDIFVDFFVEILVFEFMLVELMIDVFVVVEFIFIEIFIENLDGEVILIVVGLLVFEMRILY